MVEKKKRTALGWLNLISPKDFSSAQLVDDIEYGPHQRHRLDIYAPRKALGLQPVMFFIYGGGWSSGDRGDYEFAGRALAALGFVTVVADYRLFPEVEFPDFLKDLAEACNWTIANIADYGGDASQIFMCGHSAGGYNAVMLALTGETFGATDLYWRLKGVIGLAGPYDFYPFDVPATIASFSKFPEPAETQPINHVRKNAPPMLFPHGLEDTSVHPDNSKTLARLLREAGVPVTECYYENKQHWAPLLGLNMLMRWHTPVYRDIRNFVDPLKPKVKVATNT